MSGMGLGSLPALSWGKGRKPRMPPNGAGVSGDPARAATPTRSAHGHTAEPDVEGNEHSE
jgi:hypothetical protein